MASLSGIPILSAILPSSTSLLILTGLFSAWILYFAWTVIYNLYFHPLAKFPGPKITAATKAYEFYWDVIKEGQFFNEIQRMHAKYGPIVRINPHEIHVNDAEFYETLYAGGGAKRDKYTWFTNAAGAPCSAFATESHNLHRLRRGALNPFFSKQSILALEPFLHKEVGLLIDGMKRQMNVNEPFDFGAAYMSLALDVVSYYCFGEAECWNCLKMPGFDGEWKEAMITAFESSRLIRYIPWCTVPLQKLRWQTLYAIDKTIGLYFKAGELCRDASLRFLAAEAKKQGVTDGSDLKQSTTSGDPTIFSEILNGKLPASEKEPQRLIDESKIVIVAGGEAITQLLTVVSYFMLANPDKLKRLQDELRTVMPEGKDGLAQFNIKVNDLEKLPYLTAIIQEGLRISAIVTVRLPRIATEENLEYGGYEIPAGTPISQTSHFIHLNPEYWPEPMVFEPERWTSPECDEARVAAGFKLTELPKGNRRYLVPFAKGSRMCVGVNLTHAMTYLTLATVFRTFDFELFETTRKDVTIQRDCFNGQPWKGTKGVRATVQGIRA